MATATMTAAAVVVVVQSGHEAVLGFKGDAIDPVKSLPFGDWIESGLMGQGQQRALGGIALHPPFAVLFAQHRVVAQARGAGDGLQIRRFFGQDWRVIDGESADRRVADAADLEGVTAEAVSGWCDGGRSPGRRCRSCSCS